MKRAGWRWRIVLVDGWRARVLHMTDEDGCCRCGAYHGLCGDDKPADDRPRCRACLAAERRAKEGGR